MQIKELNYILIEKNVQLDSLRQHLKQALKNQAQQHLENIQLHNDNEQART